MRTYEQLFIVNTAAAETDVDALIEQLSGIIKASGGNVDKTDKWGVRKLAYRVKRQSEGFYVLLAFSADAQAVRELERRLRVADLVLKFITVRMDERMKRVAKRQKRREKRLARKPQLSAPALPAAPAALPGAPAPAAPGAPVPAAPVPAAPEAAPAEPVAAEAAAPETAQN
ncbi:MAG TPA: 30S ribosomal protein S6 [Bryobacteraceae bacterium]|nr:30S ribosomal protein S6 [Bryobacteraceae bacterium]